MTGRAVDIFVAGACDGDRGPGGWGAVLRYGKHHREAHGAEPAPTTGDRMRLTAVAVAFDLLTRSTPVRVHADPALATRYRDLHARLTEAARRHRVRWVGDSVAGAERAGALARAGLLEAVRQLDLRCVHDLVIRQCWQCRPSAGTRPDRVAITSGGAVFHLSEGCAALHKGWRHIDRRGGVRAALTWVPTVDAITAGRGACEVCCAGHAGEAALHCVGPATSVVYAMRRKHGCATATRHEGYNLQLSGCRTDEFSEAGASTSVV